MASLPDEANGAQVVGTTGVRPGNWGGKIGVATQAPRTQSPKSRKPPPAAHPPDYVERPLLIWGIDCTALLHQHAENIVKEETRHMPPAHQATARVYGRYSTVGGDYWWSQDRVAKCAGVRRETVNRIERRLCGEIEILVKSKHQRRGRRGPGGHAAPKTRKLHPRIMGEAMKRTMRSLCRSRDHTRSAKHSVEAAQASPRLPSLREILPRFGRPRRYPGGYMVCCPAHADRHPSLSVSEGRSGQLLLHCFAGCSHARVRAALGLPPPWRGPVTLRAPKARLPRPVGRPTPSRLPAGLGVEWFSGHVGPVPFDTREPAPSVS